MAKINRAALRFGLSVAGVALGTSMLGHLMPQNSTPPAETTRAESQQGPASAPLEPIPVVPAPPIPAPAWAPVLVEAQPTPTVRPAANTKGSAPVSSRMVVEYTQSGGRVITLGRSAAAPPVVTMAITPVVTAPAPVTPAPQQVAPVPQPQVQPQVQPRVQPAPVPVIRTRRS